LEFRFPSFGRRSVQGNPARVRFLGTSPLTLGDGFEEIPLQRARLDERVSKKDLTGHQPPGPIARCLTGD